MKKMRRRKTEAEEEAELRQMEEILLDGGRAPQSVDDFDRLLLASPNSSLCWLKYMAFHLQVELPHVERWCCF